MLHKEKRFHMGQTLTRPTSKTQVKDGLQTKRPFPMKALLGSITLWILIVLLLVVVLYPLIWMLLSSFKSTDEFSSAPFWSLPTTWLWQNYVNAWNSGMSTYFEQHPRGVSLTVSES